MKKIMILIAMLAIAGTVSAALVTNGDFTAADRGDLTVKPTGEMNVWAYQTPGSDFHIVNEVLTRTNGASTAGFLIIADNVQGFTGSSQLEFDYSWIDVLGSPDLLDQDFVQIQVYGWTQASLGSTEKMLTYNTLQPANSAVLLDVNLDEGTGVFTSAAFDMTGMNFYAIRFTSNGFDASQDTLTIDNVSINVVPEPATVGMLGLGALVALLIRRVRR